jgi:hypothetical protein
MLLLHHAVLLRRFDIPEEPKICTNLHQSTPICTETGFPPHAGDGPAVVEIVRSSFLPPVPIFPFVCPILEKTQD